MEIDEQRGMQESERRRDAVTKIPFSPFSLDALKAKRFRIHPVVIIFAIIVAVGSWIQLPEGGFDWRNDIGPGARHWWPAPWEEGLILAPWGAMLLSPLGCLPDRLATALTNGLSVIIIALVARKFDGPDWIAIPILLSPPGYWLFKKRPD